MRTKQTLVLLAALSCAMLMLSACGGGGSSPSASPSAAPVAGNTGGDGTADAEGGNRDGESSDRQGAGSADAAAEQVLRSWVGGDRSGVSRSSFDAVPGVLFGADSPSVVYLLPCEDDPSVDLGRQCRASTGSEALVVLKVAPDNPSDGAWLVTEASVEPGAGWTDADPAARTIP